VNIKHNNTFQTIFSVSAFVPPFSPGRKKWRYHFQPSQQASSSKGKEYSNGRTNVACLSSLLKNFLPSQAEGKRQRLFNW
jgi:hypothetical protein